MTGLDKVLGPLLVGSYANSVLYTLEIFAVIQYYSASKKHKRDSFLLRFALYLAFITDTVCTVITYTNVYLHIITHWGDVNYIARQHWAYAVLVATNTISATIVQCFLIYRYWKISRNKYATLMLIILMLASLCGFVETILSVANSESMVASQRSKFMLWVIIWTSMIVAVDVSIAVVLLWQFSRIKSPFRATQSLIHKLMASIIGTGTVTVVFVVAILVSLLVDTQSNVTTGIGFCLGRVYTLTMLYNLNNRSSLNQRSDNITSGEIGSTINGIHVIRTETFRLDPSESLRFADRTKGDSDLYSASGEVHVSKTNTETDS